MNRFLDTNYIIAQMEEGNTLVRFSYKKSGTEEMTDEDYKKAMLAYADAVEKYLPKKLIVDMRYSSFLLGVELQEWTAEKIGTRTTCLKKMAFVVSSDLFTQVSTEQMMEEDEIDAYDNRPRYFQNLEEAEEWINA